MPDLKIKFRRIFLPHLLIFTGFIIGYTLLHWLVIARFEAFEPTERISAIAIPAILCWLPVLLIWRLPGIHLLKPEAQEGYPLIPYYMVILACLLIPTIFAQYYIGAAAGKLKVSNHINRVTDKPLAKYYKLSNVYIDRQHSSFQCNTFITTNERTKQRASNLNINVYFVCPIYDGSTKAEYDTVLNSLNRPVCWFGQEYEEVVSAGKEDGYNNRQIQDFINDATRRFKGKEQPVFNYMERMYNNGSYQAYLAAVNKQLAAPLNDAIIFEGREVPYQQRFNLSLLMAIVSYVITNIIWLVLISNTSLKENENADSKQY
ncbi:hypothetical protein [Mucilaginibacter endophyticus]|uniref:hypothetical protein n=1 Tax=Mucilaginibacter endophyticus TaxID=2675003 RepID=UPI000E0CD8A8|nr:hypothetical protein [Mucilaginibacter endophyticus]